MNKIFVKPAPGLKVRDPIARDFLPETGREVLENDLYWVRRLRDGDVILADQPAPTMGETE